MFRNQFNQKTDSFPNIIKPQTYINGIINKKRITQGPDEPVTEIWHTTFRQKFIEHKRAHSGNNVLNFL